MILLHGEHIVRSRARLTALLTEAQAAGKERVRIAAKELTPALLEETLGGDSLFGTPRLIVIEELHSLPKSAKKEALLKQLSAAPESELTSIMIWEKRQLTPTMLKKFSHAQVETFASSPAVFKWLDGFGPNGQQTEQLRQLQELYRSDGPEFIFAMLTRQVRLLLSAKDDGKLSLAPFMVTKLKKQAQQFTLSQLVSLHSKLLEIDVQQKTSASRLSLQQQLDLLVLSL